MSNFREMTPQWLQNGLAGGGALECNLTGRCPFFKNLYNPLRKKLAFRHPVLELLDNKKFQKQYGKQLPIVLEHSHNLFRNF